MRTKMLTQIYEEKIQPMVADKLEQLENVYQVKREEWKDNLIQLLEQLVLKKLEEPVYFHFHMLRTRLVKRDYRYPIHVYGKQWYLEEEKRIADWDVDFIFTYYDKLGLQLMKEYQIIDQRLTELDVNFFMMKAAGEFNQYVVKLLRYSRDDMLESSFYKQQQKENGFYIFCGEYFDFCEFIYKEEMNHNAEEAADRIRNRKQEETYRFGDFSNITLDGDVFEQYKFPYANFSNAIIRNTTFLACDLEGAVFRNAYLENVRFERCNLGGAIFSKAEFKEADFIGSHLEEAVFYKKQIEELLLDGALRRGQASRLQVKN